MCSFYIHHKLPESRMNNLSNCGAEGPNFTFTDRRSRPADSVHLDTSPLALPGLGVEKVSSAVGFYIGR